MKDGYFQTHFDQYLDIGGQFLPLSLDYWNSKLNELQTYRKTEVGLMSQNTQRVLCFYIDHKQL